MSLRWCCNYRYFENYFLLRQFVYFKTSSLYIQVSVPKKLYFKFRFRAINMSTALYIRICGFCDRFVPHKLLPLWNHPAGPKTVFFWSPVVKWILVCAGIGDLSKSADQISLGQSSSIAITGFIWARYSLIIIPKNYGLFGANILLGLTQSYQAIRAYSYQNGTKSLNQDGSAITS